MPVVYDIAVGGGELGSGKAFHACTVDDYWVQQWK